MRGLKKAVKGIRKALLWICSIGAAVVTAVLFLKKKTNRVLFTRKEKAEKERRKTYEKINHTSGADLVNDADNAGDLQSIKETLVENAEQRIQDNIAEAGL